LAETDYSLAVRVQAHLRAAGLPAPDVPDIIPVLASARETVARRIANDDERLAELRPDEPFTLTLADGAGSLSTLIAAPTRLLLSKLAAADVRDPSGAKLYHVARSRYELRLPSAYGYFTYEGPLFLARFKGEEALASAGDVTLSASFSPAADNLPAPCVPDVVLACAAILAPPQKGKRQ
jgi:hypothetical protein